MGRALAPAKPARSPAKTRKEPIPITSHPLRSHPSSDTTQVPRVPPTPQTPEPQYRETTSHTTGKPRRTCDVALQSIHEGGHVSPLAPRKLGIAES
ncbi:hypothetical protein CC2G_014389 [Coprinopsis cinerea AmutBmut pab1-1]|nr:hypothetical protein CC2G_014389 [Coprinopsis cinerea AmutBmut pab1-1]